MPPSSAKPAAAAVKANAAAPRRKPGRAFMGMIDTVIVQGPMDFPFDGAIGSDDAYAAWMWMVRDLGPDLIDIEAIEDAPNNLQALESLMPELLGRARK